MKLKLLSLKSLNDAKIYHNALEELSNNCPYYKLKFISAFSSGIENCYAFVLLDDNNSFECVMPIYLEAIKNKIDNVQYYDAKSVYGYSGPLFHEDVSEQTKEVFWSLLDQWYKEHNLVSEFIRFSLNDNYTGYSGYLNETLLNIKGKLTTPEILFNQYDRKVRKNINKAKRENVDVKVYSENIPNKIIDEFYDIYIETMERTMAKKSFYFEKKKVYNFIKKSNRNAAIAIAYFNDIPISSELVLCSKTTIFSFIGGTRSAYFDKRPNDLLKHEIIGWACNKGYDYFILGGGYGSDDGIFKYKKAFFPNDVVKYYTGRKIMNKEIYKKLIDINYNDVSSNNILDGFFPIYRKPKTANEISLN